MRVVSWWDAASYESGDTEVRFTIAADPARAVCQRRWPGNRSDLPPQRGPALFRHCGGFPQRDLGGRKRIELKGHERSFPGGDPPRPAPPRSATEGGSRCASPRGWPCSAPRRRVAPAPHGDEGWTCPARHGVAPLRFATRVPSLGPAALRHQGGPAALRHQGGPAALRHQGGPAALRHQGGPAALRHQGGPAALRHEGGPRCASARGWTPLRFGTGVGLLRFPTGWTCLAPPSDPLHFATALTRSASAR